MPQSNIAFWAEKFEKNIDRDEKNYATLEKRGWTVHLVWECEIARDVDSCAEEVSKLVTLEGTFMPIDQ